MGVITTLTFDVVGTVTDFESGILNGGGRTWSSRAYLLAMRTSWPRLPKRKTTSSAAALISRLPICCP